MGRITVETRRRDSVVEVSVTDTGIGIAPDGVDRIFDPFFTTKEVGRGTGQGLSIAHQIVKAHQGTIAMSSEVGAGTTFRLSLPLAPGAIAA